MRQILDKVEQLLEKTNLPPKTRAIVWSSGLLVASLVLGTISWSNASGHDGFTDGLLILLAVVFLALCLVSIASIVLVYRSSDEELAELQAKRERKKTPAKKRETPAADLSDFVMPGDEPAAATGGPRPANKSPRPANQAPASTSKKPRPAKKPAQN